MAGLIVEKGQGHAYLDIESVRQQIYAAVVRVTDIRRAEVTIDNVNGRAAVRLAVVSNPTINAPRKKADLRREILKVLEDQLGFASPPNRRSTSAWLRQSKRFPA